MERIKLTRRDFLKISAASGGGLVIGFSLSACEDNDTVPAQKTEAAKSTQAEPASVTPNAWLTIHSDQRITVRVGSSEMGQGTLTGIAMLIADELEADWSQVSAQHGPADKSFYNPILGRQHTGGSTAIRGFWNIARKAGATGRELMLQAAAKQWGVDVNACRAEKSEIIHTDSNRRLSYGALAKVAADLPVPSDVWLKEPAEFNLIGKPIPRLDTPEKVDGSAVFGIDVDLPGLLTAMVVRCPVKDGKLKSFDATEASKISGVKKVEAISAGVAVIATDFWSAKKGRDALSIEWDTSANDGLNSAGIEEQFKADIDKGVVDRDDGDTGQALKSANNVVESEYFAPYQAHVCMEPMNATADVRADGCDLFVPTQGQTVTQQTAMTITGLPKEKVKVHTTYLGGGFGRRSEQDFVRDAVECSKLVGKPVKVIWTREDDVMHDQYRPATFNRLRGAISDQGKIVAWEHRIAGPSILARTAPSRVKNGLDWSNTEGAKNIPYAIQNIRVSYAMSNTPVPVGFWRSVGSSQNAYITECFFDELVRQAGRDPVEMRLELMSDHPRHAGVLKLAAEKAGWGKQLPSGRAQGVAVAESFASYVAQVAEVSIEKGSVRVHKVTCAVDCGIQVNPDSIRAQMEGAIVYGLTATLKEAITVENGRIQQSNFDDYPLLTIDECPEIEVHIMDSHEAPGGIGEPGVPPIAPAVANAVLALTGKPVRRLPIRL